MKKIQKIMASVLALVSVIGLSSYDFIDYDIINTVEISADTTEQAKKLFELVNQYRVKNGLSPFKTCDIMNTLATIRAKEITSGEYVTREDGSYFGSIFTENGITPKIYNQNIYWGGTGFDTPEHALEEFKSNERQNDNLLSNSYEYLGIGIYVQDGKTYYYQLFCTSNDLKEDNSTSIETTITTTTSTPIETTTTTVTTPPIETTTTPVTSNTLSDSELQQKYNLDVNKDGNINAIDVLILKKYLLGNLYY